MANQLQDEQSPYLQQHADNPVNWYPWSEEAFQQAHDRDRPVFLSIGYSTCHWCHVMEKESFEDPEVAEQLNKTFVNIKVDREERPDIDDVYMRICQMLNGRGGWPLTIIMTPEKKPFFAATYLPKESRGGKKGLLDLIPEIREIWSSSRENVLQSAEDITQQLRESSAESPGDEPGVEVLASGYNTLRERYDEEYGGFGQEPKFPTPHNLLFLLRYFRREENEAARDMVGSTLRRMYRGGIFDQVGYGFHRYSTDRKWLLPHFEKMLYDQALLSFAASEMYQVSGEEVFGDISRKTLNYVLRDLQAPEGGFYSAEDADSEGEEGRFYVWTMEELRDLLSREEVEFLRDAFHVREEGNYREESTGQKSGKNILYPGALDVHPAEELDMDSDSFDQKWERIRKQLFDHRNERVRPHRDEKILTDWNGLMIGALSRAGAVLQDEKYIHAARNCAAFLRKEVKDNDGYLLHRYRNGDAGITGNAADYTFLTWGLLELYETTGEPTYLQESKVLMDQFLKRFGDEQSGGFYFTPEDGESLINRQKEARDGALPSSNSMAVVVLSKIARMTGEPEYEAKARMAAQAFSGSLTPSPASFTMLLCGVDFLNGPVSEVIVSGGTAESVHPFHQALYERYFPRTVHLIQTDENREQLQKIAPFTASMTAENNGPRAYVCRERACDQPVEEVDEMMNRIEECY